MLNIILGKSKTGKSTHIYNEIDEKLREDKRVILFVPSQIRGKAENEYMKTLGKSGVIGVNITTISEFVKEELKLLNLHIDEKYLSRLDRKIIITKVIRENPDLFNIFKKVRNYPGFLDALDIYMDLFRKNGIDVDEYKNIEIEDKRVNLKFKEILSIYEKYIEMIKEEYIDNVGEIDIFLKNFENSEWFKDNNISVFFDAYNNFTISEYKIIDRLLKENIDITISLNTDITRIEDTYVSSSIFDESNKTYKRLLGIANKNNVEVNNIIKFENEFNAPDDIKYIANNIFDTKEKEIKKVELENISVTLYTNILKETEAVAKTISNYIRHGYRYSDFIIYTTDIDEYYVPIYRSFLEYSMQIYSSKSRYITESILVKYIVELLNISIRGLNLEDIFNILKLGITDIDLKDIYVLENYMREFNVNKYLVNTNFTLNNDKETYDLNKLNEIKRKIVDMYSFTSSLDNISAKEYVEQIYNHLDTNNIFTNFSNIVHLEKIDATNVDKENFEMQVWNGLCDIFDSIIKIYKDEKLKKEEFANIFNTVLKDVKIKTMPPLKDQIELADINVTKSESKKIAFFVGVVEDKFPKKVSEDIFFLDSEIEKLQDKNIDIRETSISKLNMGFFNIYEAFNNISEKLYISIPSSSLDGKATRKSSLITLMEQISIFNIIGQVTNSDNEDEFNITSKDELFFWLISSIRKFDILTDEEKEKVITVYEYFKNDLNYSKILDFKKDDSNLSNEIIDEIYTDEFKTSVSRLESYKKCPFSYYMKYILKVEMNKEAKVNVIDLGNFMHGTLESFSKYLYERNVKWEDILSEDFESLNEEYENILENIIDEKVDKYLSKQKQSVKYLILKRKLVNTMKKVIRTVALSFMQSDFEPLGYEIEFKEDGMYLPMVIELQNGKKMKLIGKIDRADILEYNEEKYLRIIDYKSSERKLSIEDIKEGLSLQLITYLITLMENRKDENIKPAGLLYFNLSNNLISLGGYSSDTDAIKKEIIKHLKMDGLFLKDIEILKKMDNRIEDKSGASLINVSASRINSSPKYVSEDEFSNLCTETKNVLKEIGDEIAKGVVKIAPNKKSDACKYCNYSAVCRKKSEV